MVQRSTCLCEGEIIGIESVYTVVNGKQINIPEKISSMRKKSKEGLLTCSCGCGAKLILVAGDQMLKAQHFRLKDAAVVNNCSYKEESEESVFSKIVIKCWLNDKITNNVETRIPLSKISNTIRKYEISHFCRNEKIAINYTNERTNIDDEKLTLIDTYLKDFRVYHIVSISNIKNKGQYPEHMEKIQKKQKYCLFLDSPCVDYSKARLISGYFEKDISGFYRITILTDDYLYNYFFRDKELCLNDKEIYELYKEKVDNKKNEYKTIDIDVNLKKNNEEQLYAEYLLEVQRIKEENSRQIIEYRKMAIPSFDDFKKKNG